jgi:hypothetical protein
MRKLIVIQILFFISISSVYSQNDSISNPYAAADTLKNDFGLFTNDEIFELSLRFDINEYKKTKSEDKYLDAILTYHINSNDSINKEIKLKSRGVSRREICQFPPLSLNFKKTDFIKDDLSKIEKVKLVTHCERGNEEYLFREYLVYKLYNILTENSFKVRLVKINYINTYKESKPISTYAFFIEPIEFLAERTNSREVELTNLSQTNILPEVMDRVAIFNYMVGNTDWSIAGQHNCKILAQINSQRPELGILVPYDFDYTGLVNSRYAVPYEPLGLKTVRERYYLGMCRSDDVFQNALKEFSDKKEECYKTINEFPLLSEKSKKDMIDFLGSFFQGLEKQRFVLSDMKRTCKNF